MWVLVQLAFFFLLWVTLLKVPDVIFDILVSRMPDTIVDISCSNFRRGQKPCYGQCVVSLSKVFNHDYCSQSRCINGYQ